MQFRIRAEYLENRLTELSVGTEPSGLERRGYGGGIVGQIFSDLDGTVAMPEEAGPFISGPETHWEVYGV